MTATRTQEETKAADLRQTESAVFALARLLARQMAREDSRAKEADHGQDGGA